MADNVRHTVDAFINAVEEARRRLIRHEGRDVSVRELIRRAGFPESRRSAVAYHLNPRIEHRKGHKVPADVVHGLAQALAPVITEDELARAAQVAAGFNVADTSSSDVALAVARFFGDDDVSEAEKRAVTARLMEIVTDQLQKQVRRSSQDDSS